MRSRHPFDEPGMPLFAAVVVAVFAGSCLWLVSLSRAQSPAAISGIIDRAGYHVPPRTIVVWRRPGAPDRQAMLNEAVQWDGSSGQGDPLVGCIADVPSPQCQADPRTRPYICRYGGCDSSLLGRQITAIGAEQGGALAFPHGVLDELFRVMGGPTRLPTRQEEWDFRIANYSGSRSYINPCERDATHVSGRRYQVSGPPGWQDWEKALNRCYPDRIGGWQSTLGPECWSACATPDGLPPAIGPGPSPTPAPTATPRPTPCPCGSSASGAGGALVCNDCPPPVSTPTPQPTPVPVATPCPSPTPCPLAVKPERMPLSVRATINKALSSLGRQWRQSVAEAQKWLDEHPYYVPAPSRSTGQTALGWICDDGRFEAALESCDEAVK